MDMLSQRYACPFLILDEFICLGQLHDFQTEIFTQISEERKDKYRWEYYLHKVFDKSYEDFVKTCEDVSHQEMTKEEIKDVVNESQALLDLF